MIPTNPDSRTPEQVRYDVLLAELQRERAAPWTVSDHSTYAVLHRPDGSQAARFHVIAEAHEAARAMNAAQRFGGGET